MSKPHKRPTLEDVLDTYLAAVDEPDLDSAREWGRRFPEHAEAILDFARSWMRATTLPADPRAAPMDAASLGRLGMTVVAEVFRAEQEKDRVTSGLPIESLAAEAKARGMTPAELAARLGASVPLLGKLNRRLFDPASIPGELVASLAITLGRPEEAVALYLARPPTLSAGGFHRAKDKPTITDREDFFEAVRSDPALSEEHRARWLSFAPRGKAAP